MKRLSYSLLQSSALLATASLLSRVLGVFRDHLLTKYLGASESLDAYFAAFRIPDLIYSLLIVSSLTAIFLPEFQKKREQESEDAGWIFASQTFNSFFILLTTALIITLFFSKQIIPYYIPEFNTEQQELTRHMMMIMLISPLFFMLSSFFISIESAFHRYTTQAAAPILYNIGIIFGITYLFPILGEIGLAIGVALGAVLQFAFQIPFLFFSDIKWHCQFLSWKQICFFFHHSLPRLLAIGAQQLSILADTYLASLLAAGSLSVMQLAINLHSLPYGIIAVSLSIPAFSALSQYAAKQDDIHFEKQLNETFQKIHFWTFPSLFGFIILAPHIIATLFEYGAFSSQNTQELSKTLYLLLLGLPFFGSIPLLSRAFFAKQKTWPPFWASLIGLTANIAISIILSKTHGIFGIAIGTSIGSIITASILYLFTFRENYTLKIFSTLPSLFSSLIMFFSLKQGLLPLIVEQSHIFHVLTVPLAGAVVYGTIHLTIAKMRKIMRKA
ncbi:murein biosynthesis integral membrane protein MurJ [Candidatus Peregrinibacteria bacterium]|nr:MAG: murein biosynthesis integral membrane protein MurJ [Candidatus Peregrinibacteria bacterium]